MLINKEKLLDYKKCFYDYLRVHDEIILTNHKNNHTINTIRIKMGDETEIYVLELLKSLNCYKNVINLGNIGANSDISITDDNNITYYVQVKTLSLHYENTYCIRTHQEFPDNMLILLVNKLRK